MDCYIHRMLYMNFMVTTNQIPIIDKKIKKRNTNITLRKSH